MIWVVIGNAHPSDDNEQHRNQKSLCYHKEDFFMPKTKIEDVIFTAIMATVVFHIIATGVASGLSALMGGV